MWDCRGVVIIQTLMLPLKRSEEQREEPGSVGMLHKGQRRAHRAMWLRSRREYIVLQPTVDTISCVPKSKRGGREREKEREGLRYMQ